MIMKQNRNIYARGQEFLLVRQNKNEKDIPGDSEILSIFFFPFLVFIIITLGLLM